MTRTFHQFPCEGEQLIGTLDSGSHNIGLLVVGGGNEIRSGAHGGMSKLAQDIAQQGFPVFRYDRRGIGDSSGDNQEFLSSEQDLKSAAAEFRKLCPELEGIVAFGNCDAATALALFASSIDLKAYILANPWVMESESNKKSEPTMPNAAAIRSRYWERIKNPRSVIDLITGKIDILKLLKGLARASQKQENSNLAVRLRDSMIELNAPVDVLLANRDTTALAFLTSWKSKEFSIVRQHSNISLAQLHSASHSFADQLSKDWLLDRILEVLSRH